VRFVADLHIHSYLSRATSKELTLEGLHRWAQCKGITVVGTGDFTHPRWLDELKDKLVPAEEGLYALRPDLARAVDEQVPPACRGTVRFLLQVEISSIYTVKRPRGASFRTRADPRVPDRRTASLPGPFQVQQLQMNQPIAWSCSPPSGRGRRRLIVAPGGPRCTHELVGWRR